MGGRGLVANREPGSYTLLIYANIIKSSIKSKINLAINFPGCMQSSFRLCPAEPGPRGSAPLMGSTSRRTHYHFSTSPTTTFSVSKAYHRRLGSCSLSITALWILQVESLQRRTVWLSRREPFLIHCMFCSRRHYMLHKDPESARVIFSLPPQDLFSKSASTHFSAIVINQEFFERWTASTLGESSWFWHGGS